MELGRFQVLDIAISSAGLERLWVVFENRCGLDGPAVFGEVRIGVEAAGPLRTTPSRLTWPKRYLGTEGAEVPIEVRNTTAVPRTVGAVAIVGTDRSAFRIVSDRCSSQRLPAGDACTVTVAFGPVAPGDRSASFHVGVGGADAAVPLSGSAFQGDTHVIVAGAPSDWVTLGHTHRWGPLEVAVGGDLAGVSVNRWPEFDLRLVPPEGGQLQAGRTYRAAKRAGYSGDAPGLDLGIADRGCSDIDDRGSFTIHEIEASPATGAILKLWATFEHRCDGGPPVSGSARFYAELPWGPVSSDSVPRPLSECVYGAIAAHWNVLGGASAWLGRPTTCERGTPRKPGRYNHFEGGSIYWSPGSGAHEVHGAIREHWAGLGWENSHLGFPLTDERRTPGKPGAYNHFQGGSIYWSPPTGAHEVRGAIRDLWARLGWENSHLGFPVTDEYAVPGGRRSDFQKGAITWTPTRGASVHN